MNQKEAIRSINRMSNRGLPFILIADFKCQNNVVIPLSDVDPNEILYDVNGVKNFQNINTPESKSVLKRTSVNFNQYRTAFEKVHKEIAAGNTYLLNLTFPTEVESTDSLKTIFYQSNAKYKLWYKNKFVVFSPEKFVSIKNNKISSYPMKGTIDANLAGAEDLILSNEKERAEHSTIVDLIRNDMSIHAKNVVVEKFRYVDEVRTNEKHLLQVSSKISGDLDKNHQDYLGEVIYSLLPAGSVTGAPKKKTLEIIDEVENYDRGFYTGVFGIFDGETFDSGVMIRFIENNEGNLVYKSGGGIHFLSDAMAEYQEMIDKVYVPIY